MSKKKQDAATPRETFNLRAKPGQTIPYSQADDELRARMKKVMAEIKENPDSFAAVINYGHSSLDKLGRAANRMLGAQAKFSVAVQDVGKLLTALNQTLEGLDFVALGKAAQAELRNLAAGKPASAASSDSKLLAQGQELFSTTLPEIVNISENLDRQATAFKSLEDEARRINRQRRDAEREIRIAIGAAEKLSEKYDGKFLKKAVKRLKKDWNDENRHYLQDVVKRGKDLNERVTVLEHARDASKSARVQWGRIASTIKEQRVKVTEVTTNTNNEWKAMLAAAGKPSAAAPKP